MFKFLPRLVLLTFIFAGLQTISFSQINLTATLGTPAGSYPTLSDAFAAINAGTHQGSITIDVAGNTIEPAAPTALIASGQGAAVYTSVYIKPSVPSIIAGTPITAAQGVIVLDGADNVTIDGSVTVGGTTRDLTIQNLAAITLANSTAIRLIGNTTGGLGATNIHIKNCKIIGHTPGNSGTSGSTVTSSYCIYAGSTSTTTLSSSGTGNNYDNITIENNEITSAYIGVYVACATNLGDNISILNNNISSSNPLQQVSFEGITLSGIVGGVVSGNIISDMKVTTNIQVKGIDCGGTSSSNIQITHNRISGLYSEGTSLNGAYGIAISGGANHMVDNNLIYDLKASNYSSTSMTYQVHGIRLSSGSGHKVYYNSVHLYGDVSAGSTVLARSSAFSVTTTTVTALDIRNNIFANKMTTSLAPTVTEFLAMWFVASYNFANASLNNNAYFVSNDANHFVGKVGTTAGSGTYTLLSDWQLISQVGNPTNDVNSHPASINSNAPFTADNNLTIPNGTSTILESNGVVITPQLPVPNIDFTGVNRPAGTGTAPDIGAYEFEGLVISIDIALTDLLLPSLTGCHGNADTVRVRIQNTTPNTVDFTTDNMTVNGYTTGANPVVFPSVIINTGTLAGNASMDVVLTTNYDMTALGTHTFHSSVMIAGDNVNTNDTLDSVSINISGGTALAATGSICIGDNVNINASGYTNGGTLQWQSSPDGLVWSNIPGATSPTTSQSPTDTIYYRFISCGLHTSTIDTVIVIDLQEPVANNVTRCGPGPVTLTATGTATLKWYDAPTGGTLLDTGATFNTNVLTTTNFYVESSSGSSVEFVGPVDNTIGTGTGFTGPQWLLFDALSTFTLNSVDIYPTQAGTAIIELRNSSGVVLMTYNQNVLPGEVNQAMTVPLNWTISPGSQYRFSTNASSINLFRNDAGAVYPYTLPGVVSITGNSFSVNYYYYFYNWQIGGGGCSSPRDTATVTVTPSDTIIATSVTNPICDNTSTVLNVNSANAGYQYTWSPATGLSSTTGSAVTTTADSTITYTINAVDTATDCAAYTNITVTVLPSPQVTITTPDTAVCANSNLQLDAIATSGIMTEGDVGVGTTSNTATSTTILGPYGGVYGGARHQYLILGTELTAAGITAGSIEYLGFEVTNVNSVAPLADYTIKIGTTGLSVLTTSFVTGLPTVYSNPSYLPTTGWNTHQITPFTWDGTSNIIVEVCFNNVNAGTASGNASVKYTPTTGTNTVNYYRADNDPNVCGMLSGTPGINRPNIRFSQTAPLSYQWSPVTNLSDDTIPNPVFNGATGNLYTLQATNENNGCSNTDVINITVNPLPIFSIGNDTAVCSNIAPTPFAIFSSDNTLNYLWFDGSTNTGTLVNGPGTYWTTGTDANGCSNSDTMVVNTVDPANVDININITGTNTADLDAGAGYSSYLWSTSQSTQVISIVGNGTYYVQVTDANGCPNADTVSIIFSLGIDETADGQLQFYPNPSTGLINMAGTGLNGEPLKIEIMDISGQMVYQQNIQEPGENFIEQIDLSMVAEGSYIIRVTNKNKFYTSRIIIARK